MSGEDKTSAGQSDVAVNDVPPMRDLAFSILSLLIETAAIQLRVDLPSTASAAKSGQGDAESSMREARAAIDAANALLGSVKAIMENDARLAIEGLLTQLQIEYVHRASRSA